MNMGNGYRGMGLPPSEASLSRAAAARVQQVKPCALVARVQLRETAGLLDRLEEKLSFVLLALVLVERKCTVGRQLRSWRATRLVLDCIGKKIG